MTHTSPPSVRHTVPVRAFLFLILALVFAAPAAGVPVGEVAVLVAMHGVSLSELARWDVPVYRQLLARGGVALLKSCPTAGVTVRLRQCSF